MKKVIGVIVLIIFSQLIYATPDDGIREHESLIGYNDNNFYSIKVISYPTGTYFSHFDSAFVIERAINTGVIKSKTFINSRHHTDSSTLGNWYTVISENEKFDFVEFLIEKNIKYLFPNITKYTTDHFARFDIDLEGLKLNFNGGNVLIKDLSEIEQLVPWIREYLEKEKKQNEKYPNLKKAEYAGISDFILDEKYLFVIIYGDYEPIYYETILVFERKRFDEIIEKSRNNR